MLSPAFWEEQRKSRYAISPPFLFHPPSLVLFQLSASTTARTICGNPVNQRRVLRIMFWNRARTTLHHATYIAPFTRHISRTDPLFQVEWVIKMVAWLAKRHYYYWAVDWNMVILSSYHLYPSFRPPIPFFLPADRIP